MAFFKKNKFWLACGFLICALIGTWFYATGDVKAKTDQRVSEIKGAIGKVKSVSQLSAEEGVSAHPNQSTEDGMKAKLEKVSQSVASAWRQRYEAQRDLMKWPEDVLRSTRFVREYSRYEPPETLPLTEKGQSVGMKNLLQVYKQQIPAQMKHICAIIQTNWIHQKELDAQAFTEQQPDTKGAANEGDPQDDASPGDDAESSERVPQPAPPSLERPVREIVKWNPENQRLWFDKLTQFRNRDDNEFKSGTELPSPSQVYMLQQDLWLLEAIFNIIRTVNTRMDEQGNPILDDQGRPRMVMANDLATIKKIDYVVFGREALSLLGHISRPASQTAVSTQGRTGFTAGRQTGGSQDSDLHLNYEGQPAYHGRYVNSNLEPIEAETVRSVLMADSLPADNLELVVAKRVPVRLAVQMDEREIPRFLAACANSPFAFEVWQIRINKHDPDEKITLRGGSDSQGRASPVREIGASGVGGSADERRPSEKDTEVALRRSYDVGVEFYGIVKIYNPVNEKLIADVAVPNS